MSEHTHEHAVQAIEKAESDRDQAFSDLDDAIQEVDRLKDDIIYDYAEAERARLQRARRHA